MGIETREPRPSPEGRKEFSAEVVLEGLSYTLKGEVSPADKTARISLHIPNVEQEIAKLKEVGALNYGWLNADGEIGSIDLSPTQRKDADVYFGKIRAYSHNLAVTSPYYAAHVGRALMNNILAVADANGWRVEAFAYADGRLFDEDIIAWLERKGFEKTDHDYVRAPQTPDVSQPVLNLLRE